MTSRRDQLQERYEDALFALIMDEYLREQGRQALNENEQLRELPNHTISQEMNEKIRKLILHSSRSQSGSLTWKNLVKILNYIAVAVCLTVLLTATALAVSPTLREQILSLLITTSEKSTDFNFLYNGRLESPADYTVGEVQDFTIGWIPEGFMFEKEERMHSEIIYRFQTVEEQYLTIQKATGEAITFSVDTEDAEVSHIVIHGKSALVSEKQDCIIITWAEEETATIFCISGEGVAKEDIIKVARNIQE